MPNTLQTLGHVWVAEGPPVRLGIFLSSISPSSHSFMVQLKIDPSWQWKL